MIELVWKGFSGFVVSACFDFQWGVNVIDSEKNEGLDKPSIDAQERFVHGKFVRFLDFLPSHRSIEEPVDRPSPTFISWDVL